MPRLCLFCVRLSCLSDWFAGSGLGFLRQRFEVSLRPPSTLAGSWPALSLVPVTLPAQRESRNSRTANQSAAQKADPDRVRTRDGKTIWPAGSWRGAWLRMFLGEPVSGGSHMPLRDMWCLVGVGGNQDCVGVPGLGPWVRKDDGLTGVALMREGLPAAESGGKSLCSRVHVGARG